MYVPEDEIMNPFLSINLIMTAITLFKHNRSECKMVIIIPLSDHKYLIVIMGLIKSYNLLTR